MIAIADTARTQLRLTEWDENHSSAGRPTAMQTAAVVAVGIVNLRRFLI